MSYTPGPWAVDPHFQLPEEWYVDDVIVGGHGEFIAGIISHPGHISLQQQKANLAILAMALEMLEALKAYVNAKPQCGCQNGSGCQMGDARMRAIDVIARAEVSP